MLFRRLLLHFSKLLKLFDLFAQRHVRLSVREQVEGSALVFQIIDAALRPFLFERPQRILKRSCCVARRHEAA